VGNVAREVGTQDLLHAFFSTISYHLEPGGWGSRYPELMNELYQGRLDAPKAAKVLNDVLSIREQLKGFRPDEVVWDIENRNAGPPWGDDIGPNVTDLSNYFLTSNGRYLFDVLVDCLQALQQKGGCLTIEPY
jgi:hypothetical protein